MADGPPWCADCEWNLDAFPEPHGRQATRVDRLSHRLAFGMNRALVAELRGGPPPRPRWTPTRVFLVSVSAVLTGATVGGIIAGLSLLLFAHQFGLRVLGFFLALIALELRPRLMPWPIERGFLSRAESPEFFALLDDIADRLHAPRLTTVAVDEYWNASCGRRGWHREPTLVIGMPLWAALSPQGRVALLGHEIGHLVNSDPVRGLLTEPALATFGRLSNLFDPRGLVRIPGLSDLDDLYQFGRGGGPRLIAFAWLGSLLSTIVFTPIWWTTRWIQTGLTITAARDHQRAELHADAIALALAGSDGVAELLDCLLFSDRIQTAVARSARRGDSPELWYQAAVAERAAAQPARRVSEQNSIRVQASMFAKHPPQGLRCRLIELWPTLGPSELVDPARWSAINSSLASQFRQARHALTIR